MASYLVVFGGTDGSTISATTSLGFIAGGVINPRRTYLYDFTIGIQDPPVNAANLWNFQRFTASPPPSGSDLQAFPLNPGDRVIGGTGNLIVIQDSISGEPNYTPGAIIASKALNSQATYRWAANRSDQRLITPALSYNGYGVKTPTCGTPGAQATVEFYFTL